MMDSVSFLATKVLKCTPPSPVLPPPLEHVEGLMEEPNKVHDPRPRPVQPFQGVEGFYLREEAGVAEPEDAGEPEGIPPPPAELVEEAGVGEPDDGGEHEDVPPPPAEPVEEAGVGEPDDGGEHEDVAPPPAEPVEEAGIAEPEDGGEHEDVAPPPAEPVGDEPPQVPHALKRKVRTGTGNSNCMI